VAVVREAVTRLLGTLVSRGVVAAWREHTAGSFVVELAPVRRLYEAPRPRAARPPAETAPAELAALDAATRRPSARLAWLPLDGLGVRDRSESIVHDEMVRPVRRARPPRCPRAGARGAAAARKWSGSCRGDAHG
jgi:hypothetical protein